MLPASAGGIRPQRAPSRLVGCTLFMDQCLQSPPHRSPMTSAVTTRALHLVTAAGRGDVRHGGRNDLGHAVAEESSAPWPWLRLAGKQRPIRGEREADDAHKGGPKAWRRPR